MTSPNCKDKIAIVTRTDERYIYIWDSDMGTTELRFPFKSILGIEPGDIVRYRQEVDPRGVQYQKDIWRDDSGVTLDVRKPGLKTVPFLVRTHVVFPPESYRPYSETVENCDRCRGIAYSVDFRKVALFIQVDFEPNVVYEAFICRIPKANDKYMEEVQTLFCITSPDQRKMDQVLRRVDDKAVATELLHDTPWYHSYVEVDEDFAMEDNMTGLPTSSDHCAKKSTTKCQDDSLVYRPSSISHDNKNYYDSSNVKNSFGDHISESRCAYSSFNSMEKQQQAKIIDVDGDKIDANVDNGQASSSYRRNEQMPKRVGGHGDEFSKMSYDDFNSTNRQRQVFEDEGFGLIVRLEADYAIIWSPKHDLVCAAGLGGRDRPLGTWVSYKCFEDSSLSIEAGRLKRSSYELNDIPPKRLSYKFEDTVKCQAIVRLVPRTSNEIFLIATDDVLGYVLCSRDSFLLKQFKMNQEVEVFVVYMEDYQKPSKWMAIAANHGNNNFKKLENLPDRIEELANRAFAQRKLTNEDDYDAHLQVTSNEFSEPHFRPPEDWHNVIHVTDRKISDVLGIVICHESNNLVSVVATIFGLARLPSFLDLGTWLRMTIHEDAEDEIYPNSSAVTTKNYTVRQSKTIAPPMSTRVVTVGGLDRIVLCGRIVRGLRCFENEYLGQIFDKKHIVELDPDNPPHPNGFLVEFSVFQKNGCWYFNVLKSHGIAYKNVDHVPLELSIFPSYVGRTCDDPHTLLINSHFSAANQSSDRTDFLSEQSDLAFRLKKNGAPVGTAALRSEVSTTGSVDGSVTAAAHLYVKPPQSELRKECEDLRKLTPAQCLFGNDRNTNVANELRRYRPDVAGPKTTRGMCLVTRKADTFALAYSKKFKVVLIKSDVFPDVNAFNELCKPGTWINSTFSRVLPDYDDNGHVSELQFKYMAVPPLGQNKRVPPPTRILNNFVQVYITCKFDDQSVQRVPEEPFQLFVSTPLGNILIAETFYKKNEFHDTEQCLWVTYIREKHGCFWKIVTNDMLANYERIVLETEKNLSATNEDLLLSTTDLHMPSSKSVDTYCASIFSESLKPQELFASFGAKSLLISPIASVKSKDSASICRDEKKFFANNMNQLGIVKENVLTDATNKVPTIAELAMEELQMRQKREKNHIANPQPQSSSSSLSSALAQAVFVNLETAETHKDSKLVIDTKKPVGSFHYTEVADEVKRMNEDKYSPPEVISVKNFSDTCSSSSPFLSLGSITMPSEQNCDSASSLPFHAREFEMNANNAEMRLSSSCSADRDSFGLLPDEMDLIMRVQEDSRSNTPGVEDDEDRQLDDTWENEVTIVEANKIGQGDKENDKIWPNFEDSLGTHQWLSAQNLPEASSSQK